MLQYILAIITDNWPKSKKKFAYVPVTLLILSMARSLIWDASKYLSNSARVLK